MHTSIWTCMSYYPRHVSGLDMPIFRRNNCTNTASGILALLGGCTLHGLSPLSTGVVCSCLVERGYQMLCLCSCSSWRWACQGPKHVEDNMTYMFILKCALKLVLKNILEKGHIPILAFLYRAREDMNKVDQNDEGKTTPSLRFIGLGRNLTLQVSWLWP